MVNKFKLLSIAFSALVLSLGACSSGGTVTPSSSQPASSQPASSSSESSSTSVHQHTFSDKWSYDEEAHWHESTCEHMVKKDKELHTFSEWKETTPPESKRMVSLRVHALYATTLNIKGFPKWELQKN